MPRQNSIRSSSDQIFPSGVNYLATCVASAVLLALSQSPVNVGLFGAVGLVPWIFATRRAGQVSATLLGFALGVAYSLLAANWLAAAFESEGAYGYRSFLAAVGTALWGKGILFGVVGWTIQRVRNRSIALQVIVPALLFGMGELWISESRWGLPFILLGHSQQSVPGVAQLAAAVGVPGISSFLFAINVSTALAFNNREHSRRLAISLVVAWVVIAAFGVPLARYFHPPTATETKSLLLIQPNNLRERRWEPAFQNVILEEIAAFTSKTLEDIDDPPDLILWPENLLTSPLSDHPKLERQLQAHLDRWDIPVVTGLVRKSESKSVGEYRNSITWWNPQTGLIDAVDKVRAMPLVESNREFFGRATLTRMMGEGFGGRRVAETATARPLVGDFTLSAVLCFEVLFPGVVSDRRDEDTFAIVNVADDSWVPGETVDTQLISAGVFRAIEQRLWFVRVSHGGLSVVIDPFGQEVAAIPPDSYGHLTATVARSDGPSLREKVSIVTLPTIVGLATWCLIARIGRMKKQIDFSESRN